MRRRYGRLGLQIALILILVAVGAVVVDSVFEQLTVTSDTKRVLVQQEAAAADAVALGAAIAYKSNGWAAALAPVIAVADRSGAAAEVRDAAGHVVRSSPGYARYQQGPATTAPVIVHGRRVGSVTLKFDNHGTGAIIAHFEARRWRARLGAVGFGAVFALVVALLVAPLISKPVDRLVRAARDRGGGRPDARVGQVRGFRDMRELAMAFDRMADNLDMEDRLRRNLVANMAHELRTPIAVLQASTEAMLDGVQEVTAGRMESLHEESVRLGRMVNDLQRLAAAEAAAVQLTLVPGDLAEHVAATAESLVAVADNAQVRLVLRLASVSVRCDPLRIREVVANLITNAVKFTAPGGEVTLETGQSGDQAMLRISDTGIGIPPEDLPHVTERFFRGRRSIAAVGGSGIGLTVVDQLVRAHHGTITFASRTGEGTQVTVLLPSE